MGNEVAIMQQPQVPAFALNDLERIATAIARGGLFGSKDPHAVLTLCMLAQAEGQHPAVVFRDYDLIQGKPAKKAEAMLRDFMGSGGKVTWNRLDDECAEAVFSHPQGGTVTINWTLARATKAGLGGKDMWKKYPRQMLRSRVVSEGVRTVCPNATSGLYVPEEVRDFGPDTTPSDTPATPAPKRARDLKSEQPKAIEAQPDYHSTLVELEEIVGPGQADALADAWSKIGKDARKALADELPRLKSLCEPLSADASDESNAGTTDADAGTSDDAHPGKAIADAIIAEIDEQISVMDVGRVLTRHELDMQAMLDEDAVRVEVAADKRRNAIREEQAKAKGKAELAE
jgi:hypothetical protein